MKHANDNEVDLWLRSLARNSRSSPGVQSQAPRDGQRVVSEHLDADELNVFAEGLTPQSGRARYTEHLADCSDCRHLVVTIAQAAGVSPVVVKEAPEGGLWKKVATLFSAQVLRYAVPAVVLAAVVGISLFSLRQQPASEFVAQHQPGEPAVSDPSVGENVTQSNTDLPATTETGLLSTRVKDENQSRDSRRNVTQAPDATSETRTASALTKEESKSDEPISQSAARPTFAPEPQAPPPPASSATLNDAGKTGELSRQQSEERDARQRRSDTGGFLKSDEDAAKPAPRKASELPSVPRRAEGLTAERGRYEVKNKKDSSEAETRTVLGKRFRRQGDAWIDSAYDSARSTINVSRGSEQFRALVADEPGIRTITEQLSGEVVVVWKGRAYRIR